MCATLYYVCIFMIDIHLAQPATHSQTLQGTAVNNLMIWHTYLASSETCYVNAQKLFIIGTDH